MSDLPVLIRPIRETDHALIIDSWVNSVRYSTPAFFWVPGGLFRSIYRSMVVRLIESKPELFRVLVNEADEDQIFAWCCRDDIAVHFVFVKREFRQEGLAEKLIPGLVVGCGWTPPPVLFTHWTKDCEHMGGIEYKPSLFRELINGLSETMGRGTAPHDKHVRQGSPDVEGGRDRQAESEAIGMVS